MDKNYFKVPNSVFGAGLTKYELLVLIYLLYCQKDKKIVFPGYYKIAKRCAISKNKALKVVHGLTEKGILKKQETPGPYGKNYSGLYVVVLKNTDADND